MKPKTEAAAGLALAIRDNERRNAELRAVGEYGAAQHNEAVNVYLKAARDFILHGAPVVGEGEYLIPESLTAFMWTAPEGSTIRSSADYPYREIVYTALDSPEIERRWESSVLNSSYRFSPSEFSDSEDQWVKEIPNGN